MKLRGDSRAAVPPNAPFSFSCGYRYPLQNVIPMEKILDQLIIFSYWNLDNEQDLPFIMVVLLFVGISE